jgi:hypothetical protein
VEVSPFQKLLFCNSWAAAPRARLPPAALITGALAQREVLEAFAYQRFRRHHRQVRETQLLHGAPFRLAAVAITSLSGVHEPHQIFKHPAIDYANHGAAFVAASSTQLPSALTGMTQPQHLPE